jgi:hypothetical protein
MARSCAAVEQTAPDRTVTVPILQKNDEFCRACYLLCGDDLSRGVEPMPHRNRQVKTASAPQRDHHRQMLLAVLYLCGVVLLINAWLVSQQVVTFH